MTQPPLTEVDLIGLERFVSGMSIEDLLAKAEAGELTPLENTQLAINLISAAAERCAQAHEAVRVLADGRAEQKAAAIQRLMQTTNDATGQRHSASSAEKVVEFDAEYRAYRQKEGEAEVERWRSLGEWEASKRRADLALELYVRSEVTKERTA